MVSKETEFQSFIAASIIAFMYLVITSLPDISTIKSWLNALTFLSPELKQILTNNWSTKIIISLILFFGTKKFYLYLMQFLGYIFSKCNWLLRTCLGRSYVNGTWIGTIKTSDGSLTSFVVEHYKQTLTSLKINGWSFGSDREEKAKWNSTIAQIDSEGSIYCIYDTDVYKKIHPVQGIGKLFLAEAGKEMSGYAIDTDEDKRLIYKLIKIDDKIIDKGNAMNEVFRRKAEL